MAWPQRAPSLHAAVGPTRAPASAPVPDIEGLRRAALQTSWRRDRRVAQRRTAMRWAIWYGMRGLPLVLMAAAAAFWLLPKLASAPLKTPNLPGQPSNPAINPTVFPRVQPGQNNFGPEPAAAAASAPQAHAAPTIGEPGIQLRLESPLQPISPAIPAVRTPAVSALGNGSLAPDPNSPSPQLKPDNWLHSKEPKP